MSSSNKRIVILGAGYAGIFLATNIARYLKGKAGEVILIDRNPYHQLLQEIHLVATGFRTANEVKIPILRLIDGMNIKFNKKQNIVIVGGGATGVSLGGALSDFIKDSKKTDSLSITIVEALPTILSGWDERLVKKVNEVLHKKGIRIMTRSPVTKVENCGSSVYLSDDDATKIHYL